MKHINYISESLTIIYEPPEHYSLQEKKIILDVWKDEATHILEMSIFVVAFVIYWDAESFSVIQQEWIICAPSIFVSYIRNA